MRKFAMTLLVILFTAQGFGEVDFEWEKYKQARQKLVETMPSLISMGYDRPNDLEMQLGLAFIFKYYDGFAYEHLSEDDLEKIAPEIWLNRTLLIDSSNKVALALKNFRRFHYYSDSEAWLALNRLKMEIDTAKSHGFTDRKFERETWLFDFFKQEVDVKGKGLRVSPRYYEVDPKTRKYYMAVIKQGDYDKALDKVLKYLANKETEPLIKEIDTVAKNDPGNALYDYLKANIYFSIGQMQKGLNEVRKGSKKKSVNSYIQDSIDAMVYVLEQFPFTESEIALIIDIRTPMVSNLIASNIWKDRLEKIGSDFENKGEYKKAIEIYELVVKATDQCKHEQRHSYNLAKKTKERIEKVKKKMEGEQELRKEKKI